ncbi:MAG: aminoacyl-tRNA hydrolase [Deltaproteobacteria bacterium]|nr:aminoacyl-tRNA hydrolase [Deltaproteobacteria bacterium]
MLLLVGLGNPGAEYAWNRHNVGFMVAERIRQSLPGAPAFREKFSGEIAKGTLEGCEVVVLRPLTFMNLSGRSVQRAAAFFQVPVGDIVVVHDDLDLPFKAVRVKLGGGTGGHKGLKSVTEQLGSSDYMRVRLGIGRPAHGSAEDYVLSDFDEMETRELEAVVERATRAVACIVTKGVQRTMNEFNTKEAPEEDA